jgi:hypothetical protein
LAQHSVNPHSLVVAVARLMGMSWQRNEQAAWSVASQQSPVASVTFCVMSASVTCSHPELVVTFISDRTENEFSFTCDCGNGHAPTTFSKKYVTLYSRRLLLLYEVRICVKARTAGRTPVRKMAFEASWSTCVFEVFHGHKQAFAIFVFKLTSKYSVI